MNKILYVSGVATKSYDNGKSAKRAFLLLLLLTCYYVLRVLTAVFSEFQGILPNMVAVRVDIFMMVVTCIITRNVFQGQRRWSWLDYYSLSAVFSAIKQDRLVCCVINDIQKGEEKQKFGLSRLDQNSAELAPHEQAMRKNTLRLVKYALWNTDPNVQKGIFFFFIGIILLLLRVFFPEGVIESFLTISGGLAAVSGWLMWFIAWYNLL